MMIASRPARAGAGAAGGVTPADRTEIAMTMPPRRAADPATAAAPRYAVPFAALRGADLPRVGGKGANLGELAAAGFPVPDGFCVTTDAFRRFLAGDPALAERLYAALEALPRDDVAAARATGAAVRAQLDALPMPADVAAAVEAAWRAIEGDGPGGPTRRGDAPPATPGDDLGGAYAVRSSATAEDLPGASFAGQQDSYLGVRGREALLDAVRRCWISLFTDRAILYRAQHGFDHRGVALAVVVQRMIAAEASGILFTADPVSGHRGVASIDAGFGLGEALVGGLVTADLWRVDAGRGQVLERRIGHKGLAIRLQPDGGTVRETLSDEQAGRPALTDAQAIDLARLGARIAAHYGAPQDIEWCIDGAGAVWLVQSRPITTLFPVPELAVPAAPGTPRLFISFGHVQVMTDPFTPIGRDAFRLVFPFDRASPLGPSRILAEAAGRLYVDLAPLLASAPARRTLPRVLSVADRHIAAALEAVVARPGMAAALARQPRPVRAAAVARFALPLLGRAVGWLAWRDVDGAAATLARYLDDDVAATRARLDAAPAGAARLAAAEREVAQVFERMLPRFIPVIAGAMLSRLLLLRLGAEPADVAALLRGLRGNVTTDMDLAVGDLADVARRHPALAALLASRPPAEALAAVPAVEGGPAFLAALDGFLARYGMRGGGEIDLGRARWADDPSPLLAVIAGNLAHDAAGAHRAHFAALVAAGEAAVDRVAAGAGRGWLGPLRRPAARRLARALRGLMAVREHPKFALIRTFGLLRAAAADAAAPLVAAGRLAADDVWLLRLAELRQALADPTLDLATLVDGRRAEMARWAAVRPPRLITGDGEIPEVSVAAAGAAAGALVGTAASAGVVEGVARVIADPGREVLRAGEILVAPFTDPGWTPLFINAAGLVMEVGGLMTHGSVVAREYGIPAVVGVPDAVARLATGMRLRVNGDQGWVEVLAAAADDGDAGR